MDSELNNQQQTEKASKANLYNRDTSPFTLSTSSSLPHPKEYEHPHSISTLKSSLASHRLMSTHPSALPLLSNPFATSDKQYLKANISQDIIGPLRDGGFTLKRLSPPGASIYVAEQFMVRGLKITVKQSPRFTMIEFNPSYLDSITAWREVIKALTQEHYKHYKFRRIDLGMMINVPFDDVDSTLYNPKTRKVRTVYSCAMVGGTKRFGSVELKKTRYHGSVGRIVTALYDGGYHRLQGYTRLELRFDSSKTSPIKSPEELEKLPHMKLWDGFQWCQIVKSTSKTTLRQQMLLDHFKRMVREDGMRSATMQMRKFLGSNFDRQFALMVMRLPKTHLDLDEHFKKSWATFDVPMSANDIAIVDTIKLAMGGAV